MDTSPFKTPALATDSLTQEIDLIAEVVNPYICVLTEFAYKSIVSKATRVPHVIVLLDHIDAHEVMAKSGLQESATVDVLEWVQREVWSAVKRNYGCVMSYADNILKVSCSHLCGFRSYHAGTEQLLQERPTSFLQRQISIWTNLGLRSVDTFVLLSHALIYFDSLKCCIACATSTEAVNLPHKFHGKIPLNLEKINMLWNACIYIAVLALTHWEAQEGPYQGHAHLEHKIWEAL
jgi:hypothetical protein